MLAVHKRHSIRHTRARGAVAVDLVGVVGIAEGNAADHAAVIAELEVTAGQRRMTGEGCLRDGAETERVRGQHEIADIGTAIERTVNAKRLVGVNDRNVQRTKEIVILLRFPRIGGLAASAVAESVLNWNT